MTIHLLVQQGWNGPKPRNQLQHLEQVNKLLRTTEIKIPKQELMRNYSFYTKKNPTYKVNCVVRKRGHTYTIFDLMAWNKSFNVHEYFESFQRKHFLRKTSEAKVDV